MDDEDDLRERIVQAISLWSLNGSEFPGELADEIMTLIEAEREEDYRSHVIDSETRA
jgi:hypothetical protein